MKKLNKKGFTLIELIVVIAILAILAAILIPSITGYISKATQAKDSANCRATYSQVSMQLMLDQTLSPIDGGVVSGLTVDYTVADDVITAFSCTGGGFVYSAPNFVATAP
jgi:type IV pilus assembly protein PilA